jgi:hypothetical protein
MTLTSKNPASIHPFGKKTASSVDGRYLLEHPPDRERTTGGGRAPSDPTPMRIVPSRGVLADEEKIGPVTAG